MCSNNFANKDTQISKTAWEAEPFLYWMGCIPLKFPNAIGYILSGRVTNETSRIWDILLLKCPNPGHFSTKILDGHEPTRASVPLCPPKFAAPGDSPLPWKVEGAAVDINLIHFGLDIAKVCFGKEEFLKTWSSSSQLHLYIFHLACSLCVIFMILVSLENVK